MEGVDLGEARNGDEGYGSSEEGELLETKQMRKRDIDFLGACKEEDETDCVHRQF